MFPQSGLMGGQQAWGTPWQKMGSTKSSQPYIQGNSSFDPGYNAMTEQLGNLSNMMGNMGNQLAYWNNPMMMQPNLSMYPAEYGMMGENPWGSQQQAYNAIMYDPMTGMPNSPEKVASFANFYETLNSKAAGSHFSHLYNNYNRTGDYQGGLDYVSGFGIDQETYDRWWNDPQFQSDVLGQYGQTHLSNLAASNVSPAPAPAPTGAGAGSYAGVASGADPISALNAYIDSGNMGAASALAQQHGYTNADLSNYIAAR